MNSTLSDAKWTLSPFPKYLNTVIANAISAFGMVAQISTFSAFSAISHHLPLGPCKRSDADRNSQVYRPATRPVMFAAFWAALVKQGSSGRHPN